MVFYSIKIKFDHIYLKLNYKFSILNYLAHAYLSFKQDEVLVGNFVGDYVKGKQWENLPYGIAKGVLLHREIDYFTDQHPEFIKCKRLFSAELGHYGMLFPDVVFDHFLANDSLHFTNDSLKEFSEYVYKTVESHIDVLPRDFSYTFWHIKSGNWLYSYRFKGSLENSLRGMVRRSQMDYPEMVPVEIFRKHYAELEQSYKAFFPELEAFVKELLLTSP